MTNRKILEELPKFKPKNAPYSTLDNFTLRISGAVVKPQILRIEDILRLPEVNLTADFVCLEGWCVEKIAWSGVSVKTVLELAQPKPSANYVLFKAGEYTILLGMDRALREDTILAYKYKGKMLTYEHGAPLRLIYPSQQCYESVKWISEIEVLEQAADYTGKRIALSRLQTTR
ncbi:MAG: molybdopterin-dependent oxidoreductase [Nitrososphaerales archaeon]